MGIASIVHWHCQKVLPLTYDDSLSYYECICKLIHKVNEVIDTFNDYEEIIQQLTGEIADIESLKSRVTELENKAKEIDENAEKIAQLFNRDNHLQNEIDELTNQLNNLIESYDNIITYVDNAVAGVKVENSVAYLKLQNEFMVHFRELELLIDALTKRVEEIDTSVYNRVAGKKLDLETNNWAIYEDLRDGGMTNAERSEFGGTNDELARKILNNRDYAINGRMRCKMHWLFSPVTGNRTPHYNAISQTLALVTNGLTNDAFAELDLTNDEVVALDLTNIQKFLYNPNGQPSGVGSYIKYDENFGAGLTVEQYEGLFVGN